MVYSHTSATLPVSQDTHHRCHMAIAATPTVCTENIARRCTRGVQQSGGDSAGLKTCTDGVQCDGEGSAGYFSTYIHHFLVKDCAHVGVYIYIYICIYTVSLAHLKNRHCNYTGYNFQVDFQDCEKRLLAASCLSVCPSVRMEQLGSYWTDFYENLYLSFLIKKTPTRCTNSSDLFLE